MKKKFFLLAFSCLMIIDSFSQEMNWVDSKSKIEFAINNLGITTNGNFKGLTGKINWNPNNLANSYFFANIDASTIDTDLGARDKHLKKEDYLDVIHYPSLSFKTSYIKLLSNGQYLAHGLLTIKNISRNIDLIFTVSKQADGYLFTGELKINRRDFNVGGRSLTLSNEVKIKLSAFAKPLL